MKDGIVYHYGSVDGEVANFVCGADVELCVDEARRRLHARVHSAGHLLDVCMERLGWGPAKLLPSKGHHHADSAYVEYMCVPGFKARTTAPIDCFERQGGISLKLKSGSLPLPSGCSR